MNFIELTEQEISEFIMNDPKLIYMGFSDPELVHMYENKSYKLNPHSKYIGIEENNELFCVLKYEYFTHNCVNIHPYIKSNLHGKGYLTKIYHFLWQHFLKDTEIMKVIAMMPDPCIHAIKACEKHGFKKEGYISKCHKWRDELVGINIYGLELDSEKKIKELENNNG